MTESAVSAPVRRPLRREAIYATVVAALTLLVIWAVAVPFGPMVCPAIYPAPRNCMADARFATGLALTGVVVVLYAATLAFALAPRLRMLALTVTGEVLLTVALVAAWPLVAWMP